MAVTNDVALITFVPLALVVLSETGEGRHTASVVVLMTVAANLGSMLLPVGNPQNLFLYRASGMGFLQFVLTMAPIAGLSAAMLVMRRGTPIARLAKNLPSLRGGKGSCSSLTCFCLL